MQNGHEAILISPEYQPDIILMDIRMPVMDGVEATKELRNDPKNKNIPIIAITAASSTIDQNEIVKKGFNGFLSKPVEITTLLSELSKYLPIAENSISPKQTNTHDHTGIFSSLSPQAVSKLPELVNIIESDCLSDWERFRSKQPMKDVRKFGQNLKELGQKFDIDSLENYGNTLTMHVDNFDVDSMQTALDEFPVFLSELKSIKGENI